MQMDAALLYRLASLNQQQLKTGTGTGLRTGSGILPESKSILFKASEKKDTVHESYSSQSSKPSDEIQNKYARSQDAEQHHTRNSTHPTGISTQDPSRSPPTKPNLNIFIDSPGLYKDSRQDPGSSAISTPDTESSKKFKNNFNTNLSLSVSPHDTSMGFEKWNNLSKNENEMQKFSPKVERVQSSKQGWGPRTDSSNPIQSPGNILEEDNFPWKSSRAVGKNDVPVGFQLNRTIERSYPGAYSSVTALLFIFSNLLNCIGKARKGRKI